MTKKTICLVTLVIFVSGCASVMYRIDTESFSDEISPGAYPGARLDFKTVKDLISEERAIFFSPVGYLAVIFCGFDALFSFFADTVCLPYDLFSS